MPSLISPLTPLSACTTMTCAGAIITHPFGGIMRSVLVALYELNADEVFVVGHYDCGMSNIKTDGTLKKMLDRWVHTWL